jgi:hypothetical protein
MSILFSRVARASIALFLAYRRRCAGDRSSKRHGGYAGYSGLPQPMNQVPIRGPPRARRRQTRRKAVSAVRAGGLELSLSSRLKHKFRRNDCQRWWLEVVGALAAHLAISSCASFAGQAHCLVGGACSNVRSRTATTSGGGRRRLDRA